jgi:mono/diheme cytochrome c family protein
MLTEMNRNLSPSTGRMVQVMRGLLGLVWALSSGCQPTGNTTTAPGADNEFQPHADFATLPPENAALLTRQVRDLGGTPAAPRLVGEPANDPERWASSLRLYRRHCGVCHGHSGAGDGLWSDWLPVVPRDFRRGVFKFQSTPYGSHPVREDLRRTITRGIAEALMPPFAQLSLEERDQLALAVEILARRGELEGRLMMDAEVSGQVPGDVEAAAIAKDVADLWHEAAEQVLVPLTAQPDFTLEMVERGRQKFVQKGCSKCHGDDGRGQTEQNLQGGLRDIWGHPVRAADLTTGRLKGGAEPIDIYRRILGGINGTPMPSFRAILWAEPDSIWDLVAWVRHLGRHDATPFPDSRHE